MAYMIAKGTTYSWPVSGTPTVVPNVESIKPHNASVAAIRFKALNDTDDTVVGGGIHVANEISLRMAWDVDNAVHAAMFADFQAVTSRASTITYPAGGSAATIAYAESIITAWDIQELTDEGLSMVNVTVAVSSVTLTP